MKEIVIKSKRVKKQLIGPSGDDDDTKRESLPDVPCELRTVKSQYELLRAIHYGHPGEANAESQSVSLLNRELSSKINSYKQQDIKKGKYDQKTFITMAQLREKLIYDLLTCVFCGEQTVLLYDKVRDAKQWTLDRIDNDKGHSSANTQVACLKCNLQRRRTDYDKFHWTKNFTITKHSD